MSVQPHHTASSRTIDAEELYEVFLSLNEPLKVCCTDWQVRTTPGGIVFNDHLDARWDRRVLQQFWGLHRRMRTALQSADLAPLADIARRLCAAAERISAGDVDALTRPLSDSYHDVWMELHNALLEHLGRSRSAADGS